MGGWLAGLCGSWRGLAGWVGGRVPSSSGLVLCALHLHSLNPAPACPAPRTRMPYTLPLHVHLFVSWHGRPDSVSFGIPCALMTHVHAWHSCARMVHMCTHGTHVHS